MQHCAPERSVLPPWLFLSLLFAGRAALPDCAQHRSMSECIVFRNQHGCIWHVPTGECVADKPCTERPKEQCHTELTTGELATWDLTTNKCFWDQVVNMCRWADECIGHQSRQACIMARCSWESLCTPMDMSALPGPGVCSETCMIPGPNTMHSRIAKNLAAEAHRNSSSTAPEALTEIVQTTTGKVQGLQSGKILEFLGIPFAQAPVGNLRWAPPQPLSWNSIFEATSYGPSCTQAKGYYFSKPDLCQGFTRGKCLGYSEDCLNLNIWTPSTSGSRAVMVWIHGGCFVSGSASSPSYNGWNLAETQDIVVVSIQFRLASFGFLGDDLLRPRDPAGSTGNYGLMDNVAALQWIQTNIANFGGDPSRVTIFGESSGAGQVSQLLGVEDSWPYFQRAIMESGTGSFWTYIDIDAAYTNFAKVDSATGCTSRNSSTKVQCLLDAPSNVVSSAVTSVPCRDGCTWAPVVDGIYVKGRTVDLGRDGKLRPNTSIISGFNLNDGAMFVIGYPNVMSSMTSGILSSYYAKRFGIERVTTLGNLFPVPGIATPSWLSRYFYSAQECETDFSYACTAQWVSSATTLQGSPTYVYQFSEPSWNGLVLHGDDIGYVFGTLASPSSQQKRVSKMVMSYWANFAKTGDPNGNGLPSWPLWSSYAPLLNISASTYVAYVPNNSFVGCQFFKDNWAYYEGCLPQNPQESIVERLGSSTEVVAAQFFV